MIWTDWQHVGLFTTNFEFEHDNWNLTIHCYESRWGTRKVEIYGSYLQWSRTNLATTNIRTRLKTTKLWQQEIYPWLKGRVHSKIPGYEFVKSQKFDFTKKLKGQAPIVLNDDE